jgi:5'-phosphate synthase pdxT subunit
MTNSRTGSAAATVGLISLQGGVIEHVRSFTKLGFRVRQVRLPEQLEGVSAIVLPGGESTTLMGLLNRWKLAEPLSRMVREGVPTWGTCAGAVLLSAEVSEREHEGLDQSALGLAPVRAVRNAFGRQAHSFSEMLSVQGLAEPYRGVFIRAPLLQPLSNNVEVLASLAEGPVFLRSGNVWLSSFHPELTDDIRIHRMFSEESGFGATTSSS